MDPLLNKRSLPALLLVTGLLLVAGSAGAFVPSAKPLAACKTLQSTRAVASILPHTPSPPRPISRLRLADSAIAEKWSPPDFGEIAKYGLATGVQFALIAGAFRLIDGAALRVAPSGKLPLPAVGLLFVFLSLRSRVASVLDNSRPNRDAQDGGATPPDVRRPSWTPPGIAFPFIWLTITALRGASSAIVYGSVGALATGPLLAMVLHLCIGDTWNTVTNVEKRLGVSAMGCLLVWASVINAIVRYYRVSPLAGKILAPSGAWISIATVLTMTIWRINSPIQPPWPVKGDGKSAAFKWSNLGQLQATTIGGSTPTVKKRKINNLIDLESKKVATMEMVEPPAKKVYCRCWQSGTFPLCDGSHMKHNEATGDNVGPLIVTVKEQ